ncbi:hypothetical protein MMC30_009175 [Trapelia coarctata]|nr:hypothetical protein [Trapelia coarctata]
MYILQMFLLACSVHTASALAMLNKDPKHAHCLTEAIANQIVENYKSLFVKLDHSFLDKTVASDFKQYSATTNFGLFYESPWFAGTEGLGNNNSAMTVSKAQLAEQVSYGFGDGLLTDVVAETVRMYHTCDTIIFRSYFHGVFNKSSPLSTRKIGDTAGITTINILEIELETLLVKTVWVELDLEGFSYDMGFYVCFQKGNNSRCAN